TNCGSHQAHLGTLQGTRLRMIQSAPEALCIAAQAEKVAQAEALMLEWNDIANDIPFDNNRLHLLLVAVYQPLNPIHFEALALLRKGSAPAPATPHQTQPQHTQLQQQLP
ncbi:hypothetical protein HDU78_000679, partial [Chytriomyces hyalinus]